MMVMKMWLHFLLFTFFFTTPVQAYESWDWNGLKLQLPFPKNWLANEKVREKKKDPLVFFEPSKSPRITATLYHTFYELNPKDYSAFKDQFLKSKIKWLKKNKADMIGDIIFNPPKSQDSSFQYELTFKNQMGKFKEFGQFRRCKEIGFTLKALIPQEKWSQGNALEIMKFFSNSNPCN